MSDCACTVAEIERLCGETNAPGLNPELAITCIEELLAIPAASANTHEITTPITYRAAVTGPPAVAAGKFYKWSFDVKDAKYECTQDENGLWNTTVNIFILKMKKTKTYKLKGMSGNNYVALVQDMNKGGFRLVGALDNGCKVTVKETTDPKNGYEVAITWSSNEPPYWYSSTITY